MHLIAKFKETYSLKGIGTPEYYLGGNFHKVEDPELTAMDIKTALSAETYIKNSIEKFERMFGEEIHTQKYPMKEASHPESDDSAYLSKERATQYRAIIGSLNWVVILGRFDVMYATNTLARFSIAPRVGHLCEARRILGYLKRYLGHRIIIPLGLQTQFGLQLSNGVVVTLVLVQVYFLGDWHTYLCGVVLCIKVERGVVEYDQHDWSCTLSPYCILHE
jgi:hypothetical protein